MGVVIQMPSIKCGFIAWAGSEITVATASYNAHRLQQFWSKQPCMEKSKGNFMESNLVG